MQAKCTQEFFDKKNGIKRKVGEIFDVTEERAKEITDFQEAKGKTYIEIIEEQPPEETPQEQQADGAQEQTTAETSEEQQAEDVTPKASKKAKKAAGADNA